MSRDVLIFLNIALSSSLVLKFNYVLCFCDVIRFVCVCMLYFSNLAISFCVINLVGCWFVCLLLIFSNGVLPNRGSLVFGFLACGLRLAWWSHVVRLDLLCLSFLGLKFFSFGLVVLSHFLWCFSPHSMVPMSGPFLPAKHNEAYDSYRFCIFVL